MHSEWYTIPEVTVGAIRGARQKKGRVVAVGTTALRALEAAAASGEEGVPAAGAAETSIFVTPGYRFRAVDTLITNFHLPRSTLLLLVSAFIAQVHPDDMDIGRQMLLAAYAEALGKGYRFYSFGDAMLIL